MSTTKAASLASALCLVLVGIAIVGPPEAAAHPNGLPPDNKIHTYCLGSTMNDNPHVRDAADYAMNNLQAQTEFSRIRNTSCDSAIDVQFRVIDGDRAGDPRGEWVCVDISAGKCNKATVTIWPDVITGDGGPYFLNLRKTTCHEVGHSADQTHHGSPWNDCMISGPVSAGHLGYNGDHVDYINDLY